MECDYSSILEVKTEQTPLSVYYEKPILQPFQRSHSEQPLL